MSATVFSLLTCAALPVSLSPVVVCVVFGFGDDALTAIPLSVAVGLVASFAVGELGRTRLTVSWTLTGAALAMPHDATRFLNGPADVEMTSRSIGSTVVGVDQDGEIGGRDVVDRRSDLVEFLPECATPAELLPRYLPRARHAPFVVLRRESL